ncbi:orotate phosphoribosyltransferase [Streptococcus pneumoniae]|nr:orotate phosphoribosyltransferase [Streptococcus pneumoniae]
MTLAKDIASHLLKIQAVYLKPEEPFTWASGIKSPIYTDNRVTLAYPETRTLIENGFVEAIKEAFPEVEVIAGTATAGIPHGAIIADKMDLPFAYIRSKPKDHGAGNQIEGRVAQGQKMVVVEDLISTGGSVLEAVAAAKREGADVLGREASRGDQLENAAYFVKKGYAEDLQESDLTLDSLEEKLSHLLSHKEDYQAKMKASKELKSLADFYQLLKKDLS